MVHMDQKRLKHLDLLYDLVLRFLERPMHGRELAQLLRAPHTSVRRALRFLESENVVCYEAQGRNNLYSLKGGLAARTYVLMAENHKRVALLKAYPHLEHLIESILAACDSRLILLFGSHASCSAGKGSDIDVFIETEDTAVKKRVEKLNTKLHVTIGLFRKNSGFGRELLKNHVVLRGSEELHERLKVPEGA